MSKFHLYQIFIAIGETGSISRAAQRMNISPSSVSKRLTQLESELGVKLVERSTHGLAVTPLGEKFLHRCRDIIQEVGVAESEIREDSGILAGTLKLSIPELLVTKSFFSALEVFSAQNSRVTFEIEVSNEVCDLVDSDVNFSFRTGELADSRLIAQHIVDVNHLFCASPAYVKNNTIPDSYKSLVDSETLIVPSFIDLTKSLKYFFKDESLTARQIAACYRANNLHALCSMAEASNGVALLPQPTVQQALDEGRLVNIYPDYTSPLMPLYLVYTSNRHMTMLMVRFKDFVKKYLKTWL